MNEVDENVFSVLEISKNKIKLRLGRESKLKRNFGYLRGSSSTILAKHLMELAAARSPCRYHFFLFNSYKLHVILELFSCIYVFVRSWTRPLTMIFTYTSMCNSSNFSIFNSI